MKMPMGKPTLLLLAIVSLSLASYGENTRRRAEGYSAVAVSAGGSAAGKSMQFSFSIDEYTTDAEVLQLVDLLKEKGRDALRRKLEKVVKGRLNPVGGIGNDIAVARKRQEGPNTIITIVTARVMPFIELYASGRSTEYHLGFLQVRLDAKGQGTGQIMAAAQIRFNKKEDRYEIESFGNQYIKAVNVRPLN